MRAPGNLMRVFVWNPTRQIFRRLFRVGLRRWRPWLRPTWPRVGAHALRTLGRIRPASRGYARLCARPHRRTVSQNGQRRAVVIPCSACTMITARIRHRHASGDGVPRAGVPAVGARVRWACIGRAHELVLVRPRRATTPGRCGRLSRSRSSARTPNRARCDTSIWCTC